MPKRGGVQFSSTWLLRESRKGPCVCVCVCAQSTINLECNPGTGALPIQPPDFLPGTIPLVPRIQETIELRNLVEPQWVGLGVIFIL